MTDQALQFPRFYVTAPGECPYIEGEIERKVFTELEGPDAAALNEALCKIGFRRSQTVAYRPACENCQACISVRVCADRYKASANMRKIAKRNSDLIANVCPAIITEEQYGLLNQYLTARHRDGSMTDMTIVDYQEMVESSTVNTVLIEYRRAVDNKLMAVALTDEHGDGLSMVYSFFCSNEDRRSLGSYMIIDHIERSQKMGLPYVYLGYWVQGSPKMSYKSRFRPLEKLSSQGWVSFDDEVTDSD